MAKIKVNSEVSDREKLVKKWRDRNAGRWSIFHDESDKKVVKKRFECGPQHHVGGSVKFVGKRGVGVAPKEPYSHTTEHRLHVPENSYTRIDRHIVACNDCGAHAANEQDIEHHLTCVAGDSKYWERHYNSNKLYGKKKPEYITKEYRRWLKAQEIEEKEEIEEIEEIEEFDDEEYLTLSDYYRSF